MYESTNNEHIEQFCQTLRFKERNSVLSEIMKYEREDKTLFEIIEILEESLAKQEPELNALFRKIARRQVGYYEKGLKYGAKLTRDEGISHGELSYMETIENR